jgi:hypothetical protein
VDTGFPKKIMPKTSARFRRRLERTALLCAWARMAAR